MEEENGRSDARTDTIKVPHAVKIKDTLAKQKNFSADADN